MPTDVNCVTHQEKRAVGYCSRCQLAYCADCLDVEMGQPLCVSCKRKFSQAAAPTPALNFPPSAPPAAGSSPLNFKGRGLDDDLLGLLGGPATPAAPAAPKIDPPKAPLPKLDLPASAPAVPKVEPPKASAPKLDFSISPPASQVPASPTPKSPVSMASAPPLSAPKLSLDLESLTPSVQAPQSSISKTPSGPSPLTPAAPLSFPQESAAGLPVPPPRKKNKFLSLAKIWVKYLLRRSYEMFDPLAQKLKVPTYVFLALVAALIGGLVIGAGAYLNRPSVAMADSIPSIHIVQVNSSQISEMDVTTYTDLQSQLQTMGFEPLMQMTVPQLPSPNFFDVGIKENIGTYSEILKRTGTITPHLSFVTVFTNGVWYSTNAWEGKDQQMEYLVSEFYPTDTPDQLYVKHVQGVEKLKQDKDWQVGSMNQNRYMAALSDHLRWFLVKEGMQGYNATFDLWH